ncbi:MAG: U32 family peptidase [Clostridiales bacterium]|nr:U32 family peptidase [Clostridiales bacterium]
MPESQSASRMPELLAPAGGLDALHAAVNAGADAVYLGVEEFNARRGAQNFARADLAQAVRYAHLRQARVYLAANVLIKRDEMSSALDLVAEAWAAGVDAVIVQDLGFAGVVRKALPDVRLHASTQIGAHDPSTIAKLAQIGFARVTLAREVTLGDVRMIAREATPEIEIFAHGALCVSHSGQCLLSSVVGGRSANRGQCAQPCRLPYELYDDTGAKRAAPGRYLLSPKDLCTIEMLPAIIAAGVDAIKIEGRMKAPEYVAVVTSVYRAALNRAFGDPEGFTVTQAEHGSLAEAFSRGFTTGHLGGQRGEDLMGYSRPNNRGVAIGRVSGTGAAGVAIDLDRAIDAGDVLEFWTKRGRFTTRVDRITLKGASVTAAPSGTRATVAADRPVATGDRVFRVVSASLDAAARRLFVPAEAGRIVSAEVSVKARLGEPLTVTLSTADQEGRGLGPIVEPARTKALTAADIMEHAGRLGGTPFKPEGWEIELDQGVGMSFSALHAARRMATDALEDALLTPWADRVRAYPHTPSPGDLSVGAPTADGRSHTREMPDLVVWTTRLATAKACLAAGAHRAIVPEWALEDDAEIPERVSVETSRVAHACEFAQALGHAKAGTSAVASTLGLLSEARRAGADVWAHWGLNAINEWTVELLAQAGASGVWLSPEVSGREISQIARGSSVPVGTAILGRQEVMVLEHCVISSTAHCSGRCGTCPRRTRWYALKDRKGYGMPVIVDPYGRTHVFNAVPLDLTRALDEVISTGVGGVRIDFTVERLQEAQQITKLVRAALESVVAGRGPRTDAVCDPATAGHFFRGVS